jgi:exopolysaccharide biosynthesis polyprenyl glycosylphosphotransferase
MAQLPAFLQDPVATHPGRVARQAVVGQIGSRARPKIRGLGHGERRLLQAAADWVVVVTCVSGIFLASNRDYPKSHIFFSAIIVSFLWFFLTDAFDAYKPRALQSRFYSVYNVAQVLAAMGSAYILISWFAGGFLPLVRPRISEIFTAILLLLPLLIVRSLIWLVLAHGPLRRRIAVVGANADGYEMVDALMRYPGDTYEFLGFFDDGPSISTDNPRAAEWSVHPTSDLIPFHATWGVDQIVLANPDRDGELLHTLSICHERGVQITPMFAIYQDLTGRVPVSHLGQDWYVALPANVKETTRPYLLVKRLTDIVLALVGLALCSPILPLLALAIKLDSPGPVFFKQVRVGLGGKLFKIIKFRSMRSDAEEGTGAVWARRGDSRITRVGWLLRRSRLDEIPQLWNVLVGDMSVVGPRPERPEFDEQLEGEIPFYRARRAVRPGLTGWAQVRHGYGNTMLDALRKVEYDLYYIKNKSLYLDMLILLRTVATVLKLRGT